MTMEKVHVGIAGCGSVSQHYLPTLKKSPYVEVVGVCDVIEERAKQRKAEFGVPHDFSSVEALLSGTEFELFVNLTSMPAHYDVNKQALLAGKHVWSEKPLAPTHAKAVELVGLAHDAGVQLLAAPNAVTSPQFRHMTENLANGTIGKAYAAHGCYGHGGPTWGPWFYGKGGGCMGDLAVYNITTLTGFLGPAKAVVALAGTAIPERHIEGQDVHVNADDNVMLLLDHGNAVFSHVQTGFVYGGHNTDRTIEVIGTKGVMNLMGWDWEPRGVEIRLGDNAQPDLRCTDPAGYVWQSGAAQMAESLATGKRMPVNLDHVVHVIEIMAAAYESAASKRCISIDSVFPWPIQF